MGNSSICCCIIFVVSFIFHITTRFLSTLQGLLLLNEIPEILPEDGMQTASYNTMADIPGYSQSDDRKTCLQLLYKILYRAVFALTQNK